MNFIIRNPFITNVDRKLARDFLEVAEYWAKAATLDKESEVESLANMMRCLNKAARCLGFRNASDMERYKQIHGKLP